MARVHCLVALLVATPAASFAPVVRHSASLRPRVPAVQLVEMEAPPEAPVPRDPDFFAPYSEMELAEQEAKLTALSKKWAKREELKDYQDSIRSGFGPSPELINGRTAMFFIVTGLVTEYYTGQSMPQQVYTMLQTLSIVE